MAEAVLHCYADYKWTGPSEPLVMLCRELCRRGWQAELACARAPGRNNSLATRARAAGLTVHEGPYVHEKPSPADYLRDTERLSRLIERGRYGVVHAHGPWDHVLAASALHRGPSASPLVRTDHGAREYTGSLIERLQFSPRWTRHLIVLSDRLRARAVERLRLDPRTVTTIRGAVDLAQYRPGAVEPAARNLFGLGPGDVVFGLVARVQPHRRFNVLLEAACVVARHDSRVRIAVLGRGTHREALLDRPIQTMGLQRTVHPLGYRGGDYRQVLAMLDAGIMLVPGSDGSCRAAMQMAAMGKPLVVAERGVLPEIVQDGETGIVVRDTPRALAEAILEMAAAPVHRRQWGEAARNRMENLYSPDRQAEAVIGVYERMLHR